jgi:hypothetical protein
MGLLEMHPLGKKVERFFLGRGGTAAIGFIIGWLVLSYVIEYKCVNNESKIDIPWNNMWYGALIIMIVRYVL